MWGSRPMRVGMDIDGVNADFITGVSEEAFAREGEPIRDWNEWDQFLKWDRPALFKEIMSEPSFWLGLKPYAGAQEGINILKAQGHEIVWITHRAEPAWEATTEWLTKYGFLLPGEEPVVFATGSLGDGTKTRLAEKHGVTWAVDDHAETVHHYCDEGVNAWILDRPWNQHGRASRRLMGWSGIIVQAGLDGARYKEGDLSTWPTPAS